MSLENISGKFYWLELFGLLMLNLKTFIHSDLSLQLF